MTDRLRRVTWEHPDAVALRAAQSAEIAALYAAEDSFRHRADSEVIDPDSVVTVLLGYADGRPAGHVALRTLGADVEIKRMYVVPARRGSGLADELLAAVERAARDTGAPRIVLHTGNRQHAALRFYRRHGYTPIPVYPPYEQVTYSRCFEKVLAGARMGA